MECGKSHDRDTAKIKFLSTLITMPIITSLSLCNSISSKVNSTPTNKEKTGSGSVGYIDTAEEFHINQGLRDIEDQEYRDRVDSMNMTKTKH